NAFEYGLSGLTRSFDRYRSVMTDIGSMSALFQAMDPLVACFQLGVLYWLGAERVISGSMSWGDVITFAFLAQLFQRPVNDVAAVFLQWRMSRENARRVSEYLHRPIEFAEDRGSAAALSPLQLEFERTTVVAPSGAQIVRELDFR